MEIGSDGRTPALETTSPKDHGLSPDTLLRCVGDKASAQLLEQVLRVLDPEMRSRLVEVLIATCDDQQPPT